MLGAQKSSGQTRGLFYVPNVTFDIGLFVTDKNGYIFSEFFKQLASQKNIKLPPSVLEHPDNAANEYVRNYDMVIVLRTSDNTKVCYSAEYRNKLPSEFTEQLRRYLDIQRDDTVLWSDDIFKDPQEAPAREVIYGQKPEPPPKKPTRAQTRQKWAHPGGLSREEMDYLTGKSQDLPEP